MKKLDSILIWGAGYDNQTASQCTSSEIRKLSIAGTMVFIPALLALFSYSYAFYLLFGNSLAAVSGGIVSAIILFIIDRSIMSYGRPKFSWGLIGRVLLAITLGFLLAEPFILKVSEDSIDEHQFVKTENLKAQKNGEFDEKIAVIRNELNEQRKRLNDLQQAYTGEMDGTSGSGIRNQGPIYQQKYNDYKNAQIEFAQNQAAATLQIEQIERDKQAIALKIEESNGNGLLGRVRALSALGEEDPIVFWTTWLLRISFILIELLPLLIKISPTGDIGLYYKIVDMNDLEKQRIFEMSSKERLDYKQKEEKLRLAQAFAELCLKQTQILAEAKEKDTLLLMEKAQYIADKKIDFIAKAVKHIKDEGLLKYTLGQFDQIHEGFMLTINNLLTKSNINFQQIIKGEK